MLQELHYRYIFCRVEDPEIFDLPNLFPTHLTEEFSKVAAECKVVLVTPYLPKRASGSYHNTAVVFDKDGPLPVKYRKMHIPDDPAY